MDTSKQYILMCEKAKEIQKLVDKQVNFSDYIDEFIFGSNLNYFAFKNLRLEKGKYAENNIIWLPRQDQLQEILKDTHWTIYGFFEQITKFMSDSGSIDWSWEQVWLGFVMKEKYNKVWNGTDWEKEIK